MSLFKQTIILTFVTLTVIHLVICNYITRLSYVILIFLIFKVLSRNGDGLSDSDRKIKCKELNNNRANFTICCKYPTLVMFRWQFLQCLKLCPDEDECCIKTCNFRSLDFIPNFVNAENHNPCNGLSYSFLLSVGNNSEWVEPISESCKFCFDEVARDSSQVDECNIPYHLYDIINCVYSENYFRCPNFNPFFVKECELTREYNDICCRL